MRILLVQTAFLGDVILSTPVIGALKRVYPEAELWVMTTPAGKELLQPDPRLSGVLTFDKRRDERGIRGLRIKARELASYEFTKVYSLHKSWRTALLLWLSGIPHRIGFKHARLSWLYTDRRARAQREHEVLRNLSLLAADIDLRTIPQHLELHALSSEEVSPVVQSILDGEQYVAIFPASAWRTKQWSKEGFREVVRRLDAMGKKVILLGAQADRTLCAGIAAGTAAHVIAGQTTLGETMTIVSKAATVLSNDSMALHLASAFKRPVVAVFCATSPEFGFGPWMTPSAIVEHTGLSCKPCARHGGNSCPTGTESCMREIDPERVFSAVESFACHK